MVSTGSVERLLALGSVWLMLATVWAASCLWVERDARRVVGHSTVWKLVFTVFGTVLFLATFQYGLRALPPLLPILPLCLVGYVGYREILATPEQRLLPHTFLVDRLRAFAARTGIEPWLRQRLRSRRADEPSGPATPDLVTLLKKDGRTFNGHAGGQIDRETSLAIKSVQGILATAIQRRATDVHLEPKTGDELQIRLRIDGILQNLSLLRGEAGRAVVSAFKVLGDMDIAERRRPQDGTFAAMCNGRKFDIRAASGPTNFGEKVALRLLDADGGIVKAGLDALGMRPSMAKALRSIIHLPHGMLVVCGPTGSGKTTSVYGALGEIDVLTRNIVTIEDPIEYRLDNISQTAVNNAADLTFAKILRSVLRQDPDVILVGEIRDKETAEIAMQAALTGHFVFTTLHANDTATTVTRLLDIGIESTLIQSAITAVLAQRLVRLLCPACKESYTPKEEFLRKHGIPTERVKVFYREKGCPECHGTGYRGRTGVYELLVFDNTIRALLNKRPSIDDLRAAARRNGMRSLTESGLAKVMMGITSINEIKRVTQ
jgi:type II secretory ATPase GspE/PulE/Tfp pilus assembly ATPase PilB-like protein